MTKMCRLLFSETQTQSEAAETADLSDDRHKEKKYHQNLTYIFIKWEKIIQTQVCRGEQREAVISIRDSTSSQGLCKTATLLLQGRLLKTFKGSHRRECFWGYDILQLVSCPGCKRRNSFTTLSENLKDSLTSRFSHTVKSQTFKYEPVIVLSVCVFLWNLLIYYLNHSLSCVQSMPGKSLP